MERIGTDAVVSGGNESLVKRVLYGTWDSTKKILASQSPEAWGKRIVTIIDTKVVPHLSPEQQKWMDDHREGIREVATYAGVGITTAEIVGAAAITTKVMRRFQKALSPGQFPIGFSPRERLRLAIADSYRTFPTVLMYEKLSHLPGFNSQNPDRKTAWFRGLSQAYNEKYSNTLEASMLAATMRVLIDRLGMVGINSPSAREEMMGIALNLANDKKSVQVQGLARLRKQFVSAFVEASNIYYKEYDNTTTGAFLQTLRARQLFDRWRGIELLGLTDVVKIVEPHPGIIDRVAHGIQIPLEKDFYLGPVARMRDVMRELRGEIGRKYITPVDPLNSTDIYQHGSFIHPESVSADFNPIGLIEQMKQSTDENDRHTLAENPRKRSALIRPFASSRRKELHRGNRAMIDLARRSASKHRR